MTTFIGPREGWDEHAAGTIRIEIDIELWSNSGREKHTSIDQQGAMLAEAIRAKVREMEWGDDVAAHDLRYYGSVEANLKDATMTNDVGIRPGA